jgi:hypothetical protein
VGEQTQCLQMALSRRQRRLTGVSALGILADISREDLRRLLMTQRDVGPTTGFGNHFQNASVVNNDFATPSETRAERSAIMRPMIKLKNT